MSNVFHPKLSTCCSGHFDSGACFLNLALARFQAQPAQLAGKRLRIMQRPTRSCVEDSCSHLHNAALRQHALCCLVIACLPVCLSTKPPFALGLLIVMVSFGEFAGLQSGSKWLGNVNTSRIRVLLSCWQTNSELRPDYMLTTWDHLLYFVAQAESQCSVEESI